MNIFKKIFGDDRERAKVVDGAIAGLDKMFFTDEERAEASQKLNAWYIEYLKASQPQNLARRLIAVIVTVIWALIVLFAVMVYPLSESWSAAAYETLDKVVNRPFEIIIGFYFLAHITRQFQKKAKGAKDAED